MALRYIKRESKPILFLGWGTLYTTVVNSYS